jgi:predicted NAD-dependent protein-ADP-ribosyltransferase YbiA (DUF1768 family)
MCLIIYLPYMSVMYLFFHRCYWKEGFFLNHAHAFRHHGTTWPALAHSVEGPTLLASGSASGVE